MPQLCWSPSVQHLALWQRQERSWRLWRGDVGRGEMGMDRMGIEPMV